MPDPFAPYAAKSDPFAPYATPPTVNQQLGIKPKSAGPNWLQKAATAVEAFKPLAPMLSKVEQTMSPVLQFMQRLPEAGMAAAAGQNFQVGPQVMRALKGDETPEQYAADTHTALSQIGLGNLSGAAGKAATFGLQTVLDPTNYIPFGKLHSLLEADALPTAMRIGEHIPEAIAKPIASAHAFLGVDSPLKQYLAKEFGPKWIDKYAGVYAARAVKGSTKASLERALVSRFNAALHGLSESEQRRVLMALDGRNVRMTPVLQAATDKIKGLTDTIHHLEGDQAAQDLLTARGHTQPEFAQRYDPAVPRNITGVEHYREHYVPAPRKFKGVSKPRVVSGLNPVDPATFQRKNLPFSAFKDVTGLREGFERRFGSGANATANVDAEQALRDIFRIPEGPLPSAVSKTFERTILPEHLEPAGKGFTDALKTVQDTQKTAMFSLPFRHMANIGNLAAISDPFSIPGGLARYLKTAAMGAEDRSAFYARPISHGAVQTGTLEGDRGSRFAQLLDTSARKLENTGKLGTLASKPLKFAGAWFRGVGDQLWKFDDAMKASQFDRLVAKGLTPDRAGLEVNASLVDYNTSSPLADALRAWAPFVTWRTKMPVAVARSVMRNPGAVNALARAFPQAAGATVQTDDQKNYASNLPVADALGLSTPQGLADYLRGTMGAPARVLGNAGLNSIGDTVFKRDAIARKKLQDWFTYGKPTGQYLESQLPVYGQTIQPLMGKGLFPGDPMSNFIYQQTGVHQTSPEYPLSAKQNFLNKYFKDHPNAKPSAAENAWYNLHRRPR